MKIKRIAACLLLFAMCLGVVACTQAPENFDESTTETRHPQENESSGLVEKDPETAETSKRDDGGEETGDGEDEATSTVDTEHNGDVIFESETEDPRLSLECAPVTYFDAKAIYELTKPGIYDDVPGFYGYDEVTYHKNPEGRPYTKILAYCDMQTTAEAYISLCNSKMKVAPYFAVKYRTTTPGISMEAYTDSVNNSVTGGNVVRLPIDSDGEWHVEYINLSKIKQFNGETVNYFRFDFMNSTRLPVDAYVEFEYIGFFNSEEDIEMFETGKYVPVVYVDPNSGYKESSGIVHASSIDMINGMGGSGAPTFGYRGGNSTTGIDKFNHNGTTLDGGKLVFSGWTVVDGGIEKFVWSIDGLNWYDATFHQMTEMGKLGQAHINATQSYTGATVTDVENSIKGGGYQGNIGPTNPADRARGLACELLKVAKVGEIVNVRFAAVPRNAPDQLCLIAYVKNVEVVAEFEYEEETEYEETFAPDMIEPEECEEHDVSVYWYPVEGQPIENKLCLLCGEVIESRSVAFYSSFDIIEDKNGKKTTGHYGAGNVFDKDCSYIVLRDGYDFVLQGWFAVNGGVKDYMYSVDGGVTWMVAGNSNNLNDRFTANHIAAIDSAKLGIAKYDVKGMYRVNLPLKQFALESEETTVNVLFGAQLANNENVIITIANIKNVKIPAAPVGGDPTPEPEEIKFIKAIDYIYVGDTNIKNPNGGWGGTLFTYDASEIPATGYAVRWIGWAGVEGGFSKWVYSTDGGTTWKDVGGSVWNTTDSGRLGALQSNGFTNATANGSFEMSADLSSLTDVKAEVIFAAIPNSDTEKIIPMVKIININLPNECTHMGVTSWSPVAGELKESGACTRCGETVTRDITFVVSMDNISYNGGSRGWAATVAQSTPYVVNNVASMPIDSTKGITVLGWVGLNGGVSKYMWSVDGVTWHDAGNGYYHNTGIPGVIDGKNTGIANYTGSCQFNLDLSGLCDLEDGTYSVYFGAVPANNTTVVVPIARIDNVVVQ